MKSILLTILVIPLFVFVTLAQTSSELISEAKKIIYQGDIHFDEGLYLKGRGLFERVLSSEPENFLAKYYLAYTDYKLSIYFMSKKEQIQFDRFVKSGIETCKELLSKNNEDAETKALLGGIYGIQIANEPNLGQVIGPQSNALLFEAVELAPDNPRVLVLAGINKLNTPEFFGGSKTKALEYFKKAVNLFENSGAVNSDGIEWGHLYALGWLGKTFLKMKDYDSAYRTFNKALSIEPEYSWIKYNLLPKVKEKMSTQTQDN